MADSPIIRYIEEQNIEIRPILRKTRDVIKEIFPDAEERIAWGMPTFGRNYIHFSANKNHLGIYPGPITVEHFVPVLREKGLKYSKGAIQLPYANVDFALLREIALFQFKQNDLHAKKDGDAKAGVEREFWKAGNMLYPVPAAIISCMDSDGASNLITIAWTGTICTDPAMVYVSVRKSRHSHRMIAETGQFVINIPTEELVKQTDFAGIKSGRDVDKWAKLKLTKGESSKVKVPYIRECPIAIECELWQILELGTHDMFLAKVLAVSVDSKWIDDKGKFHLQKAKPIVYSHGEYFGLGEKLGKFGFSVRKKEDEM